ncbi:hypothetical protein GCM10009636_24950 [Arthrobacter koreensis]|uniref:DUF6308 family protein n=1 Tax=Arthrobacter koreensis TaxID=199136 RepID=UPI000AAA23C2|nr:DUF6308 family protein [Arthrobacter koreensis]
MKQELGPAITVAGRLRTLQEALAVLERYPRKTPATFDYPGGGELDRLTVEEVIRTRKISSRISNKEVAYFVEVSAAAPWISFAADLADAGPESTLFAAMTDLYLHFAEGSPKGVSFAKISKVLHLKQPSLFPILDSHIARSYAPAAKMLHTDYPQLGWRRRTWLAVRNDLLEVRASGALTELRHLLRSYESDDANKQQQVRLLDGLTDLRLLDILVW